MSTLIVIDAFLSNPERANTCKKVITQLRDVFTKEKILLINKNANSYGLEDQVDHYYHQEGFLLREPPQQILNSSMYERPYTYLETSHGVFENWFPLTGVTDHAANIYNTFVIGGQMAKNLGFKKVFKVEYDVDFDSLEIQDIKKKVDSFKDFLLFGKRKQGKWAKSHQYLVDVQIAGYDADLFHNFSIVENDDEFWELCSRIGYYGKWIEYIIPAMIDSIKEKKLLEGEFFGNDLSSFYPKTKFDTISSNSLFTSSSEEIPKVCRVGSMSIGEHAKDNEIVLFYLGSGKAYETAEKIKSSCKIYIESTNNVIYEDTLEITKDMWIYKHFYIYEPVIVEIKTDRGFEKVTRLSPEEIHNLYPRFIFRH